MVQISANLGFLWAELPLPQQLERACAAGFTAVECHFPFEHQASKIKKLIDELGIEMVGLNTPLDAGGMEQLGLAAMPGREIEAAEGIDQAIAYGETVQANYVSVLAGRVQGPEAEQTFVENLSYACDRAQKSNINIVIEPMSVGAAPGYFLNTVDQAVSIAKAVDAPNMLVMVDCFHTEMEQGDVGSRLAQHVEYLGHVQIASVPDRHEPGTGERGDGPDYRQIFALLDELGYEGFVGAEYHPKTTVEDGLGWLKELLNG